MLVVMISLTSNQMITRPTKGALPPDERVDNIYVAVPRLPPSDRRPPAPRMSPDQRQVEPQQRQQPPPRQRARRYVVHTLDERNNIEQSQRAPYRFTVLMSSIRKLTRLRQRDKPSMGAKQLQLFHNWELMRQNDENHSDLLVWAGNDSDISQLWAKHMAIGDQSICQQALEVVHKLENHLVTRFVTLALLDFNNTTSINASEIVSESILIFLQLSALIVTHDLRCCGLSERIGANWAETEMLRNALAATVAIMFCKLTLVVTYPSILTCLAILCRGQQATLAFLQQTLERNGSRIKDQDLTIGVELATRVFPEQPYPLVSGVLSRDTSRLTFIEVPEALVDATTVTDSRRMVRNIWYAICHNRNAESILFVNHLFRPLPHFYNNNTWNQMGVLSIFENDPGTGYNFRQMGMFESSSRDMLVCNDAKLNDLQGYLTQQTFTKTLSDDGKNSVSVISFVSRPLDDEETLLVCRADLTTETKRPRGSSMVHQTLNLFQFLQVDRAQDWNAIQAKCVILVNEKTKPIKMMNGGQLYSMTGRRERGNDRHEYMCFDVPIRRNSMVAQFFLHNTSTGEKMYFELTTAAIDGQTTDTRGTGNVRAMVCLSENGGVSIRISHFRNRAVVSSCLICTSENSERSLTAMDAMRRFIHFSSRHGGESKYSGDDYDAAVKASCRALHNNYTYK